MEIYCMAKKFGPTIKKLQRAINNVVENKILINKTQIYHKDIDKVSELIIVKRAIWDNEKQRNRYEELYHSNSDVQIVLFLRDMWYELNGWEVPTDNEEWNKAKERYYNRNSQKDAGNEKEGR